MLLTAEKITRNFFRNSANTNVFCAVKETDFTLLEGKITEIIGRSGSGKTTFANMLSGLLTPSGGRVMADNEDLYLLDDKRRSLFRNRHIGIIPQVQTGLQGLTVLENVLMPAAMYSSAADKRARAEQLLKAVGIWELCNVYSNELSGGELRRMAIARALINNPEIIIADEPTGDLDDELTKKVLDLLRLCADNGAAVLLVTHEREALPYADFIYRMNDGSLSSFDCGFNDSKHFNNKNDVSPL